MLVRFFKRREDSTVRLRQQSLSSCRSRKTWRSGRSIRCSYIVHLLSLALRELCARTLVVVPDLAYKEKMDRQMLEAKGTSFHPRAMRDPQNSEEVLYIETLLSELSLERFL